MTNFVIDLFSNGTGTCRHSGIRLLKAELLSRFCLVKKLAKYVVIYNRSLQGFRAPDSIRFTLTVALKAITNYRVFG